MSDLDYEDNDPMDEGCWEWSEEMIDYIYIGYLKQEASK